MSQKHVDLMMEAVALNTDDQYLNSIGYICGVYLVQELQSEMYSEGDYQVLTKDIQKNIDENLMEGFDVENVDCTFERTTFYEQGMMREQWAKTILAPLALELPDD